MKSVVLCGLLLAVAMVGIALAADDKPKGPVNKFCAVMPEHEIDPEVTFVYKDKKIGFCCADCIPEFKKDPEKYMKELK